MSILTKVCPQCQVPFETQHNWDVYCSKNCREIKKNMDYVKKWAEGSSKKRKISPSQRMYHPNGCGD